MSRRRLLDSHALLAYLNREPGFEPVKAVLLDAAESGPPVLMNEINIGETYYIVSRKRGTDRADMLLETILPGPPVERWANSFEDIVQAARLKAEYPLSFADCFAVTTALREDASILTGDPEFRRVERLVAVEWIM